jgi:hypothetical protein
MSEVYDRMAQAGWIDYHCRNVRTGMKTDYTPKGEVAMEILWGLVRELGMEDLNQARWAALGFVLRLRFNPPRED